MPMNEQDEITSFEYNYRKRIRGRQDDHLDFRGSYLTNMLCYNCGRSIKKGEVYNHYDRNGNTRKCYECYLKTPESKEPVDWD